MTTQYGSSIAANISISDIDLWFVKQDRTGNVSEPLKLDSLTYVKKINDPINNGQSISGLFNLSIPPNFYLTYGVGTYNFYLTPRKFNATILDVSYIDGTDIRGIVLNLNSLDTYAREKMIRNNGVAGFLVRYIDSNLTEDNIIPNRERLITANYRVEPVNASLNNNDNQIGVRYRFNDTSNSIFLIVNPTVEGISQDNNDTFIGSVGQDIVISSTYFEPQLIELEFTDYDIKTIYDGIFGNQTVNFDKGLRTFYDSEGNIITQREEITIKNDLGDDLRKIAKTVSTIDNSETL